MTRNNYIGFLTPADLRLLSSYNISVATSR